MQFGDKREACIDSNESATVRTVFRDKYPLSQLVFCRSRPSGYLSNDSSIPARQSAQAELGEPRHGRTIAST